MHVRAGLQAESTRSGRGGSSEGAPPFGCASVGDWTSTPGPRRSDHAGAPLRSARRRVAGLRSDRDKPDRVTTPRGQHAESLRGVSSRRGHLERRAHSVRDLWRHRDVHPRAPASDDRHRPSGTGGRGRADRRSALASRVRAARAGTHSAGQRRGRDAPAHQDRPRGPGGALTRRDRSPAGGNRNAWQTRTSTEWEGHSVTVVSRAGLIDLKRLRGSPQDMADIALLEGHA